MIAKIYPDGHPDLLEKKDPTHPVRYFDIRKLTPTECYRLMGVPDDKIKLLLSTEKKPYTAFVGVDDALAVFGLEANATKREVERAYKEAVESLSDQFDPSDDSDLSEKSEPADPEEAARAKTVLEANYRQAYDRIMAAHTEERFGEVQIVSNSSHYKLAGNSIVCDVLLYIYEEMLYPTGRRIAGEKQDLFALPQFTLGNYNRERPLRMVTLCSGYDSQCLAMDMLKERYPEFDYELKAWSEFDPESTRPLDEQPQWWPTTCSFRSGQTATVAT